MLAGRLRYRLTIQQPGTTAGAGGTQTETWSTFATVWGSLQGQGGIESLGGRELDTEIAARDSRQLVAEQTLVAEIRYLAGITPTMRVQGLDGRLYDIQAVTDPDGRKRELVLSLRERVA